jgi:FixJ family two-component response regulator
VWIVDDDPSVRTALARLLRATALEVEAFDSGPAVLERLARERPRCLVLDLSLPELDGLELLQQLHLRGEPVPVVFLTGAGDVASSVKAMKQGAVDFLEKPVDPDALLGAVMQALAREAEWRLTRDRIDEAEAQLATLTPREREVFEQLTLGKSNKQIACDLGTREKTIKVHRGRVMHKLRARSVVDLVRLRGRAGGVESP